MSTPTTQDLLRIVTPRQGAMVAQLERYVNVESGTYDKEGVDRAGALLIKDFEGLGFSIERIPQAEYGDHIVARRQGSGRGKLLALIHLDTVWPRGTLPENPFRIEDGKAYGPGVLDMKGGWVTLQEAIRALDGVGWDGLESITVFMVGDEEVGSRTARPYIEDEGRKADWTLVMEPARESGAVCVHRGMVGAIFFDIHGATAHTQFRERGASAILEAAHKVIELEALTDPARGLLVNVGIINGGAARQVVPDHVRIAIDLRAPTAELAEELFSKVQAVGEKQHNPRTRTVISGGITRPAWDSEAGTQRLYELARACGHELGMSIEAGVAVAGSDGSLTSAIGRPTLCSLGPEGANVCAKDEYVLVESLPRRTAMLAGIITRLPELG